jgi:ribosome-associated protein
MSKTPSGPKRTRRKIARPGVPDDVMAGATAALDKKATDLVVLDLRQSQAFTDFFVICTGANVRQVRAISDGIQEALGKQGIKPTLIEGEPRAEWVLIDYFDVIFHVFTPATREFYGLERLWGDAERIEIPA